MRQAQDTIRVGTKGQGLYEVTDAVVTWVGKQGIATGLLTLFCQHTSASLTIQENADPDVQRDLETFFKRLVEEDDSLYRHTAEGSDDMPAHIRSALTEVQLSIPVRASRMGLGTWQGIYLFEHRHAAHTRSIMLHLIGE